jgi:amino acid permease
MRRRNEVSSHGMFSLLLFCNHLNEDVLTSLDMLRCKMIRLNQPNMHRLHTARIALGGTIGTGLFVGSGVTLARGGPAFILGSYCVMSFLIFCTVAGIIEVAAYLPTPGSSMNLFGARYVSRSMGFGLGWLYFYSLGILVPYEITAAALVIEYWSPPVNIAVWVTIMIIVIVGLNCFPVKFYGETEFWFAGTSTFYHKFIQLMMRKQTDFFTPQKQKLS